MAQGTWEKSTVVRPEKRKSGGARSQRWQFLLGSVIILVAIVYLLITSTVNGARFFITVDDLLGDEAYVGQSVRLSGVVLGDSIEYDSATGDLAFTIAHIPGEFDDLAQILHEQAKDPNATQLQIRMTDTTKPDLLQHEAQAILTGTLNEDGYFYGSELNLKCPTRFEEHTPGMMAEAQES